MRFLFFFYSEFSEIKAELGKNVKIAASVGLERRILKQTDRK